MSRRLGVALLLPVLGLPARSLSAAPSPPDAGAADHGGPTTLERQACEQEFRMAEAAMPTGDRVTESGLKNCATGLRNEWAKFADDKSQYTRWLECKAKAEDARTCESIISKQIARKRDDDYKAFTKAKQTRERKALAALGAFRNKGLIGAANYKEITAASKTYEYGSFGDLYEDALQLLRSGRVRSGTQLSINPHPGIMAGVPAPAGERAGDIAFVDARTGSRVVRFSRLSPDALSMWIGYGSVGNALKWAAEKPDARSVELAIDTNDTYPAYILLYPARMTQVEAQLGKQMAGELKQRPLLVQGDAGVSYERWLALAASFFARGLDKEERDSPKLAGMVTLADMERALGPGR